MRCVRRCPQSVVRRAYHAHVAQPGHFLLRVDPTEEEQAQGERPVYVDAFGQARRSATE